MEGIGPTTPAPDLAELLARLDPDQRTAVYADARRLRVRAPAGSGKTAVLTARAGRLIQDGVPAHALCALTFSKRAAEELLERLGPLAHGAQVSTIHSLAYAICRDAYGYHQVADEGVVRRLIRQAMADTDEHRIKFAEVRRKIALAKRTGAPYGREIVRVAARYGQLCHEKRLWDFDDLLCEAVSGLYGDASLHARWRGRWAHILIDETQDTSALQFDLIDLLIGPETSLLCVGDAAQSIYAFRGATPGALMDEIDRRWGPFTDVPLRTNYRSLPDVVMLANRVIVQQPGAVQMQGHRTRCGLCHPSVTPLPVGVTAYAEATNVLDALQVVHEAGTPWGDMAVLYRMNASAEAYEAACTARDIPAVVVGGVGFYQRSEVLDVLAYLQIAKDGWAAHEALDRVFNKPSRYLGKAWHAEMQAQGGWDALKYGDFQWSKPYMRRRANDLIEAVDGLRAKCERGLQPVELVDYVLDGLGYREWLRGEEPDEVDEARSENLDTLREAADRWGSLDEFLSFAAQCARRGPKRGERGTDRVRLSTIHSAKGCEFPVVALVGLTEGVLPHRLGDPAEETRLAYVGITRARDTLFLAAHYPPSPLWHEIQRILGGSGADASVRGGGEGDPGDSGARGGGDGADDPPDVRGGGVQSCVDGGRAAPRDGEGGAADRGAGGGVLGNVAPGGSDAA